MSISPSQFLPAPPSLYQIISQTGHSYFFSLSPSISFPFLFSPLFVPSLLCSLSLYIYIYISLSSLSLKNLSLTLHSSVYSLSILCLLSHLLSIIFLSVPVYLPTDLSIYIYKMLACKLASYYLSFFLSSLSLSLFFSCRPSFSLIISLVLPHSMSISLSRSLSPFYLILVSVSQHFLL